MLCKDLRLITDVESYYPHKGRTSGAIAISGVSLVGHERRKLFLIMKTHLSIRAPYPSKVKVVCSTFLQRLFLNMTFLM